MNTKIFFSILIGLIVLGLMAAVYSTVKHTRPSDSVNMDFPFATSSHQTISPYPMATSTTSSSAPTSASSKTITLELYKPVTINGLTLTTQAVWEDSRCPAGVQCIWAGRVRVGLKVQSTDGKISSFEFQPGVSTSTGTFKLTLLEVDPAQISGHKIQDNEYRFIFKIEPALVSSGGCFIGGCSSQLCTDSPNAVSSCEYTAAYACYKQNSTCERQANGECGWSNTPALNQCLAASRSAQ